MPDFKISLPFAAKLLINQDEDTLQFCNKTNGSLVSFNEAYLDRARELGEISAYKALSPKQLRNLQDASEVLDNPDSFIALPRCGDINIKSLMLEFAASIGSQTGSDLKKAATSIFGSKIAKYQKVLERTEHTADWEAFVTGKYAEIVKKWCEENGLPYTDELIEQPDDIPQQGEFELSEETADEAEISEETESDEDSEESEE